MPTSGPVFEEPVRGRVPLPTFSTFSVEVVTLIGRHEYGWALGAAGLHLAGSFLLTGLGIFLAHALFIRT